MKKVLLIGPLPPPITGQSMAFSYLKILEKKEEAITIFNTQKFKIKLINYLFSVFVHPFKIIFSNYTTIYFIGSRSAVGFLRQLPFLVVAIFKNIRLINHLHGADFKQFYNNAGALKPLIKWVYDQVDTSILLIDQMSDQFDGFNKMKLVTVPNAIGLDFENLELKYPKSSRILYLSNIMASKGIIDFLNAAKLLLAQNQTVKIDIAGAFIGDHLCSKREVKATFFRLFDPLKASYPNRIDFHGTVSGQKKVNLFKTASIFVLPTYYPTEAFPIAILEAMACGNAIITTKHNYLEYVVPKACGEVIPIKDKNGIVENINRFFGDGTILNSIQRTNYKAAKKYTLEAHLSSIKKILVHDENP